MLPRAGVAAFLAACLAVFLGTNLLNLMKHRKIKANAEVLKEVESPKGVSIILAAVGTGTFFLESVTYVIFGLLTDAPAFPSVFQLDFAQGQWFQVIGVASTSSGYLLFIWSVLARGRHAVSWDMPADQQLVTWGPYRFVRHPSYVAYFMLFIGLILLLQNALALVPLIAVPGYLRLVETEEELLIRRFGRMYIDYQRVTGKFLPKLMMK